MESINLSTGIIVIVASFMVMLIGVVVTYFWLVKRYLSLQHEQSRKSLEMDKERERIMSVAHTQSQEIIKNAQEKAKEIISQAQFFEDKQKEEVQKVLSGASQQFSAAYKALLDSASKSTSSTLLGISEDIKNAVLSEVKGFTKKME